VILHLVGAADWERARAAGEPYAPASLAAEGFVHCTATDEVLLAVANRFYVDEPDEFVVLSIDESRLRAEVRWESGLPAPPPGSDAVVFPHVYGPLDLDAVVGVRRAVRADNGTFAGFTGEVADQGSTA
jgi:uncharacterized protein (DUF952 family)